MKNKMKNEMNTNSNLDPQNEMHRFAHITPEEFSENTFGEQFVVTSETCLAILAGLKREPNE